MNRKQLITIIVVGAVLGAVGFLMWKKDQGSWSQSTATREKLLPDFPLNDITQIKVSGSGGELNLVKLEDRWIVKERADFPANFNEISDLLRKLWELKPGEPLEVTKANLGRLELLDDKSAGAASATKLEFKDKAGKTVSTLLLGKKHMKKSPASSPMGGGEWPEGRYVMIGSDLASVCLVKESFSNVEPKPDQWLNKDFVKIEKVKSIALKYAEATNCWKITRETESGDWKLAEAGTEENLDSVKASSAGSAMAYPSFSDIVAADAKPETTGFATATVATLETFENFTYALKFGAKTSDDNNYHFGFTVAYAPVKERTPGKDEKPEDKEKLDKEFKAAQEKLKEKFDKEKALEKWNYLVSKYSCESLLKPRGEMLAKKEEPPKTGENKPETQPVEAK